MNVDTAIYILKNTIDYTRKNNLADSDDRDNVAIVVPFTLLEDHIKIYHSKENTEMLKEFEDLHDFLTKQGRVIANKALEVSWLFNIMSCEKYNQDRRRITKQFPRLKRNVSYKFGLFVLYREPIPIKYYGIIEEHYKKTEKLDNEIQTFFTTNFLCEEKEQMIEEIKDFLAQRLRKIFEEPELTVGQIGPMETKIDCFNPFLALGIRIPQNNFKEDASFYDIRNRKNGPYDVHHLANCLRELGMEATLPIPLGKRTKFTDPVSSLQCSIGVDDGLLYERDTLISEYFKLDYRIRPLVIAILYFSRSQMINRSVRTSTLSSYSYMFMLLHFLMNVVEKPIIPNLQKHFGGCSSPVCMYNLNKEPVTRFWENKILEVNIQYHTCIRINNRKTCIYSNNDYNDEKPTIWYSDNDDNLGTLFINFMDYYSRIMSYKNVSITFGDFKNIYLKRKEWKDDVIWIQDPFFPQKNITSNCHFSLLRTITETFKFAAEKLKHGFTFQEVCEISTTH